MSKSITLGEQRIFTADCFDKVKTRGRPKLKLNATGQEVVEKLAGFMCTEEEIASFLDVTVEVLHNSENKETFSECYKKGVENGKASLRRNQFMLSKTNPTMAIWLGKQYLGQKEVVESKVEGNLGGVPMLIPKFVQDASLEELRNVGAVGCVRVADTEGYESEETDER